jgi:methyl halide transferase
LNTIDLMNNHLANKEETLHMLEVSPGGTPRHRAAAGVPQTASQRLAMPGKREDGSEIDWQLCYEQGRTPWEKGQAHPGLAAALQALPAPAGRVLAPGCGTGHDLLAWRLPGITEIIGLDIAPSAVAAANARAQAAGEPRITAVEGDFFALPASMGQFDWLMEHTCFCAIPPSRRAEYAASAAAAVRPGGHFLAIFFLNPWDPPEDMTQGPPFGVERAEIDAFFDPHFELLAAFAPQATYAGREGREEARVYRRR